MHLINLMEFQIINGDLIVLLHWADYVWESDVREKSSFVGRDVGKKKRKGRPVFLLKHVLYGLLPVSVMRVFLFWCRQPCVLVTVGCSSLSPGSERVLNLDVTQGDGDGDAMTHKEPVSGRPFVNKCICFWMGMISGKLNISQRHFRKICCFVLSWHSWGNNLKYTVGPTTLC